MRCVSFRSAARRLFVPVLGGGALSSAWVIGGRRLHTPPGGFLDALPPSFGRTTARGVLSSVNLAQHRARQRQRRRQKQPLLLPHSPSDAAAAVSPSVASPAPAPFSSSPSVSPSVSLSSSSSPVGSSLLSLPRLIKSGGAEGALGRAEGARKGGGVRQPRATLVVGGAVLEVSEEAGEKEKEDENENENENEEEGVEGAAETAAAEEGLPRAVVPTPSGASSESWEREQALEQRFAVVPGCTVFGDDLDRLERDMMREFHQRGDTLPRTDAAFSQFGGGRAGKRMAWLPSSSFDHLKDVDQNRSRAHVLGEASNRNLSPYHMSAEAYREKQELRAIRMHPGGQTAGESAMPAAKGVNYCKAHKDASQSLECTAAAALQQTEDNHRDLEEQDNPHFPLMNEKPDVASGGLNSVEKDEDEEDYPQRQSIKNQHLVIDARTDYRPVLTTVEQKGDTFEYDAYKQRPAENRMLELRDLDYWYDFENRKRVEAHLQYRDALFEMEKLQEGAMDTSEVEYSINRVRKEVLLYFQAHPINEMIQESFVRIREVAPRDGSKRIVFNPFEDPELDNGSCEALRRMHMDVDVPVQEARRMAQEMGLDLVRIGSINTDITDRRIIALCLIGDHREHMRGMIKFKIQKMGVRPPPTKECIEVPFRGGTHPHAIRFKCVGIAKHILHRHSIRVNLTDFGTPREGFPVFQTILDEIKRQCTQLRAHHKAGMIQSNYNEIFCYLYPSTGRSPKTTVDHPSPAQVRAAQELRILENEKEIYFDDLADQPTVRDRIKYLTKLERGTAWADKDEGLSLQKQRAIKVMLGYLPKGNKDIYAARGDVNIPAPFRASHPTSIEAWTYPSESNLEQASRGAAVLGKRAAMPISEMHDRGETPENPSQLDRFYYKVQGPALEVGEFKEALGLKDNRRKRPPLAPGFATLGVGSQESAASLRQNATK